MKSIVFALTFALALVQVSSAQESVDSSDEALFTAYPTFMPSASDEALFTAYPTFMPSDSDEALFTAYPTFMPSDSVPSPVPTGPLVSGAPRPSGSRVPRSRTAGPANPSGSGVPQFTGSALPPCPSVSEMPHPTGSWAEAASPTVTCVNPSAPAESSIPSKSGVPVQPSHSNKSRSRPHRTTFSVDVPSFSPQPTGGPYPTRA